MFPARGLWTTYAPGAHWHYSNTGYEILGKLAEHAGQQPLARLFHDRIFAPLGMTRTRGAILGRDRMLFNARAAIERYQTLQATAVSAAPPAAP